MIKDYHSTGIGLSSGYSTNEVVHRNVKKATGLMSRLQASGIGKGEVQDGP